MDLHLHLSVAFRALDYKWGTPIDLDNSGDSLPCLPAVIENPTTTFSSEDFLKTIKRNRPKPYSRNEDKRRLKTNVKLNDSFSNISVSRMPLRNLDESEEENVKLLHNQTMDGIDACERLEAMTVVLDSKKPLQDNFVDLDTVNGSSNPSIIVYSRPERKEDITKVFKELKSTALSYIGKKMKRKTYCNKTSTV